MAVLFISEYTALAWAGANHYPLAPCVAEPPAAEQTVAIGGSSTQSAALGGSTRIVRLHTDAICSVLFGANPTALSTSKRLAANQTEYFGCNPGDKIAVISNT